MFKQSFNLLFLSSKGLIWIALTTLIELTFSNSAIAELKTINAAYDPKSVGISNHLAGAQKAAVVEASSHSVDPIGSPFPVPWDWVWANQVQAKPGTQPFVRYYRSRSLISPNGQYSAYAKIQMQVQPEFTQTRISSELVIENLKTGDFQQVVSSPHLTRSSSGIGTKDEPGLIAILLPIAWSQTSDRVLVRQFESLFGSDVATDYALIWNVQLKQLQTFAPTAIDYDTAVLLGWSQTHPEQVLFHTSILGQATTSLWRVTTQGQTIAAPGDQALIFGQTIDHNSEPRAYQKSVH